ncbi:eukaryotic aspartyl protease domain-containing protein [Trichoderma breve]|uniref:Eukaryotic aspartyl protease domain-containing protein n=1 Tax=Trichoderma breve TaxID=2034170 RepID=A0A9W9B3K7_9HYPO|nr:eukaryotic aspartyl protease domain-containing protein [Trichoderma breve]KAJ4854852.1 eukaryotic aspartyl protease domain-containing protein [Trichoderma breve]
MKTVLPWSVLMQAYLAASSPLLPRSIEKTQPESLLQMRSPAPFQDPSPNTVTTNTIRLTRVKARSSSAHEASGILSRSDTSELAGEVTVGNQTLKLIFDTGSSDLWIPGENFQCVSANLTIQSNSVCNFTTTFKGTYGSGQIVAGSLGYESVSVAGITIPDQEISIANLINFGAQGQVDGLIGLSYPLLTNVANATIPYNSFLANVFRKNLTAPLFGIAMERNNGGTFALGGLPPVPIKPSFASTPILIADNLNSGDARRRTNFTFYTIVAENYVVGDSKGDDEKIPGAGIFNVVDSGTFLTMLSPTVTKVLYAKFPEAPVSPPEALGNFLVPCNTTAPEFGIEIADQTFYMSPKDLILQNVRVDDMCALGVQPTAAGRPSILGATWLHNVLAVYDVGASQMRFAPRIPY